MTVSSTTNRKTFAGDDATTSFGTSPVVFFDSTDITVYVVDDVTGAVTTLVENTDYTITGGDGSTGTISLAGGSDPFGALQTDTTLVIVRTLPLTQEVDFVNNDINDAEVQERALDKLTMLSQQLLAVTERSVRLADSDTSDGDTLILSAPADRATKVFGFDADGVPTLYDNGSAVTESSSVTFLQAGSGAVSRTVQNKERDIVSLKDFGAIGDGVTDDVTAVQAWVNYCINNNKKGYAPAGVYKCSTKITLPRTIDSGAALPGFEIEGDGGKSGIYTVFSFSGTTTGFVLTALNKSQNASDSATTEGLEKWVLNIRFKNVALYCSGATAGTDSTPNTDVTQRGIDLHGVNTVDIDNVHLVGFGYNLRIRSGAEIYVDRLQSYYGWNNIRLERPYTDVGDLEAYFNRCVVGSGQYPIVLDHARNVTFSELGFFPGSVVTDRSLPLILVREGFLGSQGTTLTIKDSALEKNSGASTSKTGYMIHAPQGINTLIYNDNQCDTSYFPYIYIEKGWRQATIKNNRFSPTADSINVSDGASEDVSANMLLLRHTADVTARAADATPAVTLTLSSAAVGTGRTATATGAFAGSSADVGKYLLSAAGIAVITASGTADSCTVEVLNAFAATTVASGAWTLSNAPSAGVAPYYLFGNLDISGNTPRENDFSVKEVRSGTGTSVKPYYWHYAPPYVKPLPNVPQTHHPVGYHYAFSSYSRSGSTACLNGVNAIVGSSGTPTSNTAAWGINKNQTATPVSFVAGIIVTREDGSDAFVAPQIYLDSLTAGDSSYFRVLNAVPLGVFTAADGTTKFKKYAIVTEIPRAPQSSVYIRVTNFYGIDYARFYLLDSDFNVLAPLEGQGMAADSIPTEGFGEYNDFVANINPSAGEPTGWLCVSSGTPGTWIPVDGVRNRTRITATLSTDQLNIATNTEGTPVTVLFDTAAINIGSAFNTGTSIFTAPVDGTYLISVSLDLSNVDSATTRTSTQLVTSNRSYPIGITSGPGLAADARVKHSATHIVDMEAGDTAKVVIALSNDGTAQADILSGVNSYFEVVAVGGI